ncbi:MAG: TolC family protein [Chloroflexi bacterium]|nr:TolC family protein [Chloroflexota bacterium]
MLAVPHAAMAQEPLDVSAYIAIVLRSHPVAGQRTGLEAAAAAERAAVRRLPDPALSIAAGRGSPADGAGASAAETEFALSQRFPLPGAYRAGTRVGDAAASVLVAHADALRWEVSADARAAYARLVAARARLHVAHAAEQDARALRDLVTRRAELGEARESDRIKATVEWLRQQRTVSTAEREAAAAERILRALSGEPLPEPLHLAPERRAASTGLRDDLVASLLVAGHPRLLAARAEAERQRAQLSVASSSRVPDLGVTVFRTNELDKASTGVSVGFTVPLWNANRGEVARARAATAVSNAEVERVRVELTTDVEAALRDLQIAAGQLALLDGEILSAAQRSVDLARFSFEEGETSLLDLLDAQRTLRETEQERADARLALSLAEAEAQRLVGPDFTPWK